MNIPDYPKLPNYKCECNDPTCSVHPHSIHCNGGAQYPIFKGTGDTDMATMVCEQCFDDLVAAGMVVQDSDELLIFWKEL